MIKNIYDLDDAITALNDLERNANTTDSFRTLSEEISDFLNILWEVIKKVEEAKEAMEALEEEKEELERKVTVLEDEVVRLEGQLRE